MNPTQSIGIIGAGTMGSGIAQVCVAAGFPVVLLDVDAKRVERGATSHAALAECDFLIEAATESARVSPARATSTRR